MDKVLGMLGMAKRAGKVIGGADMSEKAMRAHQVKLVVIATDISPNGRKSIVDACLHHHVSYIEYADKEALGKSIGALERAVVSVVDGNFADAIMKKYSETLE